jgi:NAD(P)H-dependent flavin oxidoreductase YrpB (nitropropane dioxygenase family)
MKQLNFFLIALFVAGTAFAQTNKEDVDIIQSVLGKEKKALVAEFLKLDGPKGDAFWKLYDQYETERKTLGKQRIALLEKYAANYGAMDDAQMDQIMKETQALQQKTDKLIIKYYDKMKKEAGVKAASQFYQLENYFLSLIRATILDSIPFIGELSGKW